MGEVVKVENTIIHMLGCNGEYLRELEFEYDEHKKNYRSNNMSVKKLLEIYPSHLNPTYVEIQCKEIKKAFEQLLDINRYMEDGKGAGLRGKNLGRL